VDPVLGGVVVELQEHVKIVGDLRDGLGPLRPVGLGERFRGPLGVVAVLGVPDLRECLSGAGLGRLREAVEDVGDLVDLMPISA